MCNEQNVKAASQFYEEKIQELDANIRNVETIVQNKTNSLRAVEEGLSTWAPIRHAQTQAFIVTACCITVLRHKVLAAGAPSS